MKIKFTEVTSIKPSVKEKAQAAVAEEKEGDLAGEDNRLPLFDVKVLAKKENETASETLSCHYIFLLVGEVHYKGVSGVPGAGAKLCLKLCLHNSEVTS